MRDLRPAGIAGALMLGLWLSSCGKSPTSPGATGGGLVVSSVEVSGPDAVPPGESAQVRATAHRSDGSTVDVTKQAAWTSSNQRVLSVSSEGLVTAGERGAATITATYSAFHATMDVLVLPAATYRVAGAVREGDLPLEGVAVTVLSADQGAGLAVLTAADGSYALYGVAGSARIRFAKADYIERIDSLEVTAQQRWDVALALIDPTSHLSGNYALTLTSSSNCQPPIILPDQARSRMYQATLSQDGSRLHVQLSGADLVAGAFDGRVEPSRITFELSGWIGLYYSGDPYDLVEKLSSSPPTYLIVAGEITAALQGSSIAGTLSGSIGLADRPDTVAFESNCYANDHRVVLQRQ